MKISVTSLNFTYLSTLEWSQKSIFFNLYYIKIYPMSTKSTSTYMNETTCNYVKACNVNLKRWCKCITEHQIVYKSISLSHGLWCILSMSDTPVSCNCDIISVQCSTATVSVSCIPAVSQGMARHMLLWLLSWKTKLLIQGCVALSPTPIPL